MPDWSRVGHRRDVTSTHNEIVAPGSPKQHNHWGGRVEQVDVKDSLALLWRV